MTGESWKTTTEDLRTPAAELGRFTAVASGKGGVGKTWFAVTLAQALVQCGRRVLLFDADFGLANIDVQLGLNPVYSLEAITAGNATLERAIEHFGPGGYDILAGRSGSGALSTLAPHVVDKLLFELKHTGERYDHVLLDLGAGLHPEVRRVSAWADTLLVIATEDPTSITDAYATLKLHAADRPGGDARIVINQASSAAAGGRTAGTIIKACQAFLRTTPGFAGAIRRDPNVQNAIRRQVPLLVRHPNSPASVDVERIAEGFMAASCVTESVKFSSHAQVR